MTIVDATNRSLTHPPPAIGASRPPGLQTGIDAPRGRMASHGHWLRDVFIQFVLVFGAALAYFGVRGLTESSETIAVSNARRVLGFEDNLGIDIERSLQGLILHNDVLVTAANWMYIWGHWPVIGLTLFWLYRSDRVSYTLLRNAMFISGAIGLVIFMSFPVAPPRLMPSGFVDTVTELSTSYHVLQPPSLVNKYAAVPSLHVGWNLLVGVFIFAKARSRVAKLFAVTGPLFMFSAVVLTANHYIFDALAGSVVALTGLGAAVVLHRVANCWALRRTSPRSECHAVFASIGGHLAEGPRASIERAA